MADIKAVLKAWECCHPFNRQCDKCPYDADCYHDEFCRYAISDMVELLKEHEEHEKLLTKLGYHWTGSGETLAMCRMKDGEQDGV